MSKYNNLITDFSAISENDKLIVNFKIPVMNIIIRKIKLVSSIESIYVILPIEVIEKFKYEIDWNKLSYLHKFTLTQIEKYKEFIYPSELLQNKYIDKMIKNKIEIGIFYD